jgi:hypothetical protein
MALDPMLLRIFHGEVERQCRFGLTAADDLQAALQAGDMDRLWYSVQALLVAAGNVSKLLWPEQKYSQRGDELRASLGVPEDSPLAPRTFRNHFEHFDARLHDWAASSQRRNFADSNVGPPGMIVGLDPGDYLRNFDTTNAAVTFRGDSYELQPIVKAIGELWQRASVEAAKPHWEP